MAEVAPLTTAHAHARKAAEETQHTHLEAAAKEHHHAAGDFARAARGTSDTEALRILKLLEHQHRRLTHIINSKDTPEPAEAPVEPTASAESSPQKPSSPPSTQGTTRSKATTSALAAARIGSQVRDSSPSLAREIASRRGIPQTGRSQPSPAAQARARQLSPEAPRSTSSSHMPRVPPSIVESQASLARTKQAKPSDNDEGFAKFYDSVKNGSMSKLSSVLAYAGLPLTADDIKPERTKMSKASSKQTVSAGNDSYAHKYISKAALAALEEDQRQRGKVPHSLGPAESFYVVPPTGMMTSFADITRRRRLEDAEDSEFVEAKEAQTTLPSTPQHTGGRLAFGKARTHEELELENVTLKDMVDKMAPRLATFEAHAQDASMAALTQSMVSLRHEPRGESDVKMQQRLQELEEQIEREAEEKRQLVERAKRQEREVRKWEARYDKMYQSARSKMESRQEVKGDNNVQSQSARDAMAAAD